MEGTQNAERDAEEYPDVDPELVERWRNFRMPTPEERREANDKYLDRMFFEVFSEEERARIGDSISGRRLATQVRLIVIENDPPDGTIEILHGRRRSAHERGPFENDMIDGLRGTIFEGLLDLGE